MKAIETRHPAIAPQPILREAVIFATVMWLCSRVLIFLAMLLIAPALPAPSEGVTATLSWDVFAHWDGEHYEKIATKGYRFKDDGKGYTVAFFPLLPLLMRGGMSLGLSATAAGVLINNLAFLGAMIVLYLWVRERHGRSPARWATAALAWCPFSLFGSVVYTEGLFLLCSTAALRSFDRQQYRMAALWGALTTAIRPPGVTLIPTFLVVAWQEKRPLSAYLAAFVSAAGLLLYMLYCGWQFHQPLAFVLAQRGWQTPQDFYGEAWVDLFTTVVLGPANEAQGHIVDPWYPLALLALLGLGIWIGRSRQRWSKQRVGYSIGALTILLWLVGGSPLINGVMVFGGAFLIWQFRHELGRVAVVYSLFSWLIILGTSRTTSAERYAYGVVTLAIAFGLWLTRYPRWGGVILSFLALLLGSYAVRFAQGLWAG